MKLLFTLGLILFFLLSGCVQDQSSAPENFSEKVMLLSFGERFCVWTETSQPFAYKQFAYQEDGEIKYIKTKTTCQDFDNQTKGETIFGEKVKLYGDSANPTAIIREDGTYYEVEPSEPIRSFFTTMTPSYDDIKNTAEILRRDQVILECKLLKSSREQKNCLTYMNALNK